MTINKEQLTEGIDLLGQPVMPLAAMVQFLFMTGSFTTVAEVVDELPEPIETDQVTYENPKEILIQYLEVLADLEQVKQGIYQVPKVVDEQDKAVDPFTAGVALVQQRLLTAELEKINSLLCAPCGCTLCCVGPDSSMEQEFFEIPIRDVELDFFPGKRCDTEASKSRNPLDDDELVWEEQPFYKISEPALFHWQKGWSLILPKDSRCPNLNDKGQCRVYNDRPEVCRRPQIFPYIVERLDGKPETLRIRQSLLAVIDCPYVQVLQEEIANYAAASELHLHITQNKQ